MNRGRAYALVIAACALPRLVVLVHERASVLASGVEKSDTLAQVLLKTGTFGYQPGEPTANTQPLYGWFLWLVYWLAGRHWWSMGTAQVLVAVATALVVYEIGRRHLSARAGLLAAVITTWQPYLVWHDVHANREILDQLLGAAMFGIALAAPTRRTSVLLGAVTGVAILSNSRLVVLPFLLGGYLLWRRVGWIAAACVPVFAVVVLSPWAIRNKVQVGCFAITTDARALWKANDLVTYGVLHNGGWIDAVPEIRDVPERTGPDATKWMTPQEAGDQFSRNHRHFHVDECMQQARYEHYVWQFWLHHPGAKAKLMVQATQMLWSPVVEREGGPEAGVDPLRKFVEPIWVIAVYLLAIVGLFRVRSSIRMLALLFVVYETLAAWVFAGTTRYRVPWDFALALLAAAAIEGLPFSRLPFTRPFSQKR